MEREEILAVVKKYMVRALDDITADQIDPSRSMVEYGVTSLDIVEVVSGSMRELKVKVPRTELNDLKNIDGLVDIFYKHANVAKDEVTHV